MGIFKCTIYDNLICLLAVNIPNNVLPSVTNLLYRSITAHRLANSLVIQIYRYARNQIMSEFLTVWHSIIMWTRLLISS